VTGVQFRRAPLAPQSNRLPFPLTPLIGRERESAVAADLLQELDIRLITLTGPPGVGKTRLSLHIASQAHRQFIDGVVFVSLAPVTSPGQVLSAVAEAVGAVEAPGESLLSRVVDRLQDRCCLLVLDNFEHVTAAAPQLVELLEGCPPLKLLVTSREALMLRGEHELPVPPMTVPDPSRFTAVQPREMLSRLSQYPAVGLFLDRTRAVNPDFRLTEDNASQVMEICIRLDGLPLAIELAAARMRVLSPELILTRLAGNSHPSMLDLLSRGAKDLPPRHQALRAAIQWSYDL
jgi:predicted ATPase